MRPRAQLGAQLRRAIDSARNSARAILLRPRPARPSQAPTFSRTSARRRVRWRPPPPPPSRRPRRRLAPPTAASRCTTCCSPRSRASTSASRTPTRRRRRRRSRRRPPPRRRRRRRRRSATRARWLWRASPSGRASTSRRSPRFGWRSRLRPTPTNSCAIARPRGARAHAQGDSAAVLDTLRVVVRLTNEHAKHRVEIAAARAAARLRRRRSQPGDAGGPDDGGGGGDARDGGARRRARDAGDRGGGARGGAAGRDRRAGRAAAPFVPLLRPAGADPAGRRRRASPS